MGIKLFLSIGFSSIFCLSAYSSEPYVLRQFGEHQLSNYKDCGATYNFGRVLQQQDNKKFVGVSSHTNNEFEAPRFQIKEKEGSESASSIVNYNWHNFVGVSLIDNEIINSQLEALRNQIEDECRKYQTFSASSIFDDKWQGLNLDFYSSTIIFDQKPIDLDLTIDLDLKSINFDQLLGTGGSPFITKYRRWIFLPATIAVASFFIYKKFVAKD